MTGQEFYDGLEIKDKPAFDELEAEERFLMELILETADEVMSDSAEVSNASA